MQDFLVQCRWPDGSMEYFLSDSETEARTWAADARRDADCVAGVYGLLVLEAPGAGDGTGTEPAGRYAARCVSHGASHSVDHRQGLAEPAARGRLVQ
ncbi:MAG: hypothetical protein ACK5JO_01555 [Halodesulfovibrio sp.]